jgi:hypothetical protein
MNYARRSLLGNDAILQTILQPEIRVRIVSAFGRSLRRRISPTHATILTERELISIRESADAGDRQRYGGVWDYIPVKKIADLSVSTSSPGLLRLSMELSGGPRFDLLYEDSAASDLAGLVNMVLASR